MTDRTTSTSKTRTIAIVTIVALALGITGGWAIAALSTSASNDGDLWVVGSQSATLSTDALTLDAPGAFVEVTLGEDREANAVALSALVQDWDRTFGDDLASAVVIGNNGDTTSTIAVRIGAPEATATAITFTEIEIVGGGLQKTDLQGVTLVVDAAGLLDNAS